MGTLHFERLYFDRVALAIACYGDSQMIVGVGILQLRQSLLIPVGIELQERTILRQNAEAAFRALKRAIACVHIGCIFHLGGAVGIYEWSVCPGLRCAYEWCREERNQN